MVLVPSHTRIHRAAASRAVARDAGMAGPTVEGARPV